MAISRIHFDMQKSEERNLPERIEVVITVSQNLRGLLHPTLRVRSTVTRQVDLHTSVKDLIESLRIPHTEIGCVTVNGADVGFSYRLNNGDNIHARSPESGLDPCRPDLLRPLALKEIRFLVDLNVTKLGTLLRMVGFDCLAPSHLGDAELAETAVREGRILLTRDRNLLKRKIIMHGHLVRNHLPVKQLLEIISFYNLKKRLRPYTRCMKCNAPLVPIDKDKILHRLEPLTKKYYDTFFFCSGCRNIYWSGSHKSGMDKVIAEISSQLT